MPLTTRANTSSIASDNKKERLWLFMTGPNTVRIYTIGVTAGTQQRQTKISRYKYSPCGSLVFCQKYPTYAALPSSFFLEPKRSAEPSIFSMRCIFLSKQNFIRFVVFLYCGL